MLIVLLLVIKKISVCHLCLYIQQTNCLLSLNSRNSVACMWYLWCAGWGELCDELNTDLTDCADAREWNNKNRIKTPCGVTLMLRVCDGECLWCSYVNEIHDVHQRHLPSSAMQHFAHMAINRLKTAVQGGVLYDWLNTDLTDLTDAMHVGVVWNKNRIKTPCWHTLMLRVSDGECLWCPYVNEIHDVHQRHSPSCAMQHIAPQGDKPCLWQKPLSGWEGAIVIIC